MRGFVRARGADVLGPVSAVDDALALSDSGERIDAALLDMRLGDGMCFPVADALARHGVPFLFVTAYEGSLPVPARHAQTPCCHKPFDAAQLTRALLSIMAAPPAVLPALRA
jgi:CheY-like chemotaxis protein